ncbi:MAG: zf-HC2 domain-containing protein [Candidatus Eisenbacteria bacterium]|nr:zf-HC2 domain-containing protein [Candidatus Eisenbacteria bacterium]
MKRLDCETVLEQLSEFIDQETRDELCEQIHEHLTRCKDCQVKVDTVRRTILLYQAGSTTPIQLSVSAHDGLRAALAGAYGGEGESRG